MRTLPLTLSPTQAELPWVAASRLEAVEAVHQVAGRQYHVGVVLKVEETGHLISIQEPAAHAPNTTTSLCATTVAEHPMPCCIFPPFLQLH